jgi:hypothetical protein
MPGVRWLSLMSEETRLFTILDGLVDRWCKLRALNPLRRILPAYPLTNNLTDGWQMLYDALRDVRAFCHDELSDVEQQQIGEAIVIVQDALENR